MTLTESLDLLRGIPEFKDVVLEAQSLLEAGLETQAKLLLEEKSPKEDVLMKSLLEKLEGKPVADTLKRIAKGSTKSLYEDLKGWLSLGVHAAIECEKGSSQYRILLNRVNQKVTTLLERENV